MSDLAGKTVAWMTKDFGAVMGTVQHVSDYPDRPQRASVLVESCERNCRKFDREEKGHRWSVAVEALQEVVSYGARESSLACFA